MSEIPEIGDRVRVFEYTLKNPTVQQVDAWVRDRWAWMPSPELNKLPCWGNWPIVVLRRGRDPQTERIWLTVTSECFDEPLRSQGVRVPLSHTELVQKGYGLPPLSIAPVVAGERAERRSAEYRQGALLQC